MADAGFPLSPDLLRQIAQGIVNEREMPQHGQGGGIVGPQESAISIETSEVSDYSDKVQYLPLATLPILLAYIG